jgi:hypothetical protein
MNGTSTKYRCLLVGMVRDHALLQSTKAPAGAHNKLLMKNWFKNIAVAAALLSCGTIVSNAQDAENRRGGGRFDPEEMRQRMAERMREQFAVTDDAEWKIIEGKIQKVTEARRAVGGGMGVGGMGGFGGGRRGGGDGDNNGGERARRAFGGEPTPEVEDLRKAIDAKASADEIKTKLAKVREARKANELKLEAAQEDLRKVLSVRQEAVAVMMGLLK